MRESAACVPSPIGYFDQPGTIQRDPDVHDDPPGLKARTVAPVPAEAHTIGCMPAKILLSSGGSNVHKMSERHNRGKPMSVRIFIVDDSAAMRHGIRYLLENHYDWEVCGEAADGAEAIEKYRQLRPDLLVVDVSMPFMNGLDASLEILKLSPKSLILLYTSFLTRELIETAHQSGIPRNRFQRFHGTSSGWCRSPAARRRVQRAGELSSTAEEPSYRSSWNSWPSNGQENF